MIFATKGVWGSRLSLSFFFQILFFAQRGLHIVRALFFAKRGLHIVRALYIYIVVEVTMNMVKNGSWRSQQFENVNFEPRIPGIV